MKRKVLIVDDKEIFRRSLIATLQTAGDVEIVGEVSNGEEFLKAIVTQQPEVVFMDIEMPVMNGIEATKKALARYPNLVIIGLSMYENESYVNELIEAGARGYLLKTSDNHELFKNILKYPEAEIFFSEDLAFKPDFSRNSIKNILIVDDFETNVIVMESALSMSGFKVKTSNNPFIAVKMAEEEGNRFDLFVIDYRMPAMNGAELVAELRKMKKYKKTPILMLSSETDKDKKMEAKRAGATGWLKKPFQLDKFLRIIETSL